MVLSYPAKSGLESGAWIDGNDYQNKIYKKRQRTLDSLLFNLPKIWQPVARIMHIWQL